MRRKVVRFMANCSDRRIENSFPGTQMFVQARTRKCLQQTLITTWRKTEERIIECSMKNQEEYTKINRN